MRLNGEIDNFRCGIVVAILGDGTGVLRQLDSVGNRSTVSARFSFVDVRFVNTDVLRRDLSFGDRYRAEGDTITTLRDPAIGDIVMYTDRNVAGVLCVINWTFDTIYKEAEVKLPRCAIKGCNNVTRLRKHCCAFHAMDEDDAFNDDEGGSVATVDASITRWAGGDTELAREAREVYPGDFM